MPPRPAARCITAPLARAARIAVPSRVPETEEMLRVFNMGVGLVLIVSIFVFVIYNDLARFDIFGLAN